MIFKFDSENTWKIKSEYKKVTVGIHRSSDVVRHNW